jgi:hypothetical protein
MDVCPDADLSVHFHHRQTRPGDDENRDLSGGRAVGGLDPGKPMNLKQLIDVYRAYPYWQRRGCIFIHVPKAAGTSVNHALYGRTLGHYRAVELRRRFPGLYQKCFVFSLVRNPWDRVLSAYRFAKAGRTETMGVRNPQQYRIPEFDSFERFLHEWLAVRDIGQADFIFQPQHLFVCDASGNSMLNFIGKVETINNDMHQVAERLGRPIEIRHANKTSDTNTFAKHYHRPEMIDLVGQVYARDIAAFNYDFD